MAWAAAPRLSSCSPRSQASQGTPQIGLRAEEVVHSLGPGMHRTVVVGGCLRNETDVLYGSTTERGAAAAAAAAAASPPHHSHTHIDDHHHHHHHHHHHSSDNSSELAAAAFVQRLQAMAGATDGGSMELARWVHLPGDPAYEQALRTLRRVRLSVSVLGVQPVCCPNADRQQHRYGAAQYSGHGHDILPAPSSVAAAGLWAVADGQR
jgi:hypothetical protein